nr:MAG TPA: hypothetical protein [Caudoviricetes sp.]
MEKGYTSTKRAQELVGRRMRSCTYKYYEA